MFSLLLSPFLHRLELWDQHLFRLINTGMANPLFDHIMPFMREGLNWAPLYLFMIAFALMNFRGRGGWWVLLMLATVALTDMFGTYVFKHNIERLRPCSDPDFFMNVRLLVKYCSGGFSFVSNHAANHFGLATFFYVTMRKLIGRWALLAFFWAGVIAFAQVYVGVHYPFDVLAGTLLGVGLGAFTGTLFNKRYGIVIFDNKPTILS